MQAGRRLSSRPNRGPGSTSCLCRGPCRTACCRQRCMNVLRHCLLRPVPVYLHQMRHQAGGRLDHLAVQLIVGEALAHGALSVVGTLDLQGRGRGYAGAGMGRQTLCALMEMFGLQATEAVSLAGGPWKAVEHVCVNVPWGCAERRRRGGQIEQRGGRHDADPRAAPMPHPALTKRWAISGGGGLNARCQMSPVCGSSRRPATRSISTSSGTCQERETACMSRLADKRVLNVRGMATCSARLLTDQPWVAACCSFPICPCAQQPPF